MKQFLSFEVLLEMTVEKTIDELIDVNRRRGLIQKTKQNLGITNYTNIPIPKEFDLLVKHSEIISENRTLVEYLDENMVNHNYEVRIAEIEQVKKESELIIAFMNRQRYCGD